MYSPHTFCVVYRPVLSQNTQPTRPLRGGTLIRRMTQTSFQFNQIPTKRANVNVFSCWDSVTWFNWLFCFQQQPNTDFQCSYNFIFFWLFDYFQTAKYCYWPKWILSTPIRWTGKICALRKICWSRLCRGQYKHQTSSCIRYMASWLQKIITIKDINTAGNIWWLKELH